MFQVRIHGRGGQGAVTAAEILSVAAFMEGKRAQAFPSFGSERTGAPVVSFCRFSDGEIRTREPVVAPDAVIVQDVTLLHQVDVTSGLSKDGYLLVNTAREVSLLGQEGDLGLLPERVAACPATELALRHLGRPLPNAALLGGFAALTDGAVSIEAVARAVRQRFPGAVGDANAAAAEAAYSYVAEGKRRSAVGAAAD